MIKKKHFFMLFAAEPESYTGTDSLIATVTYLRNSKKNKKRKINLPFNKCLRQFPGISVALK